MVCKHIKTAAGALRQGSLCKKTMQINKSLTIKSKIAAFVVNVVFMPIIRGTVPCLMLIILL